MKNEGNARKKVFYSIRPLLQKRVECCLLGVCSITGKTALNSSKLQFRVNVTLCSYPFLPPTCGFNFILMDPRIQFFKLFFRHSSLACIVKNEEIDW